MSLSKTFIKSRKSFKVSFTLPKANGKVDEVKLLGDFNDWNYDNAPVLKPVKNSYKVDLELEAGKKYEYRYCINRTSWVNDAVADAYVSAPYENIMNCVVDLSEVPVAKATKPKATAPKKAATKKVAPKAATKVVKKPAAKVTKAKAPKAAKVEKVDLKKIEGIGPKIAEILTTAGYTTYEKLAAEKADKLKEILTAAGNRYKMHDPTTWPQQSDLLAKGKLAELKKLQDELSGGKAK